MMENGETMEAGPSSGSSTFGEKVEERINEVSDEVVEDEDHDHEDDGDDEGGVKFVPGPLLPLKEQIDKDKDDESLKRWKEKLLGCVEGDINGQMEPEVKFRSISIISKDCGEILTPLPVDETRRNCVLFTLREGSDYQLKLTFTVQYNIVSGLTYSNTVWKGGLQVDRSKGMLGTFAPQLEPYTHTLDEDTAPSGVLARGMYSAKLKFEDDDKRCHLELDYSFEIKKTR